MIGFLLPFAAKMVGARFAKPLVYAVLMALAIGALFGAKAIYDHNVIAKHEGKQAGKVLKRERAANSADQIREQQDRTNTQKLESEVNNAIDAHPEAASNSSGPASSTALRELRERQTRQRGR